MTDTETLSEREQIERRIFRLRRAVDVYLAHGDAEDADRVRDQIGDLERQLDDINNQERDARRKRA